MKNILNVVLLIFLVSIFCKKTFIGRTIIYSFKISREGFKFIYNITKLVYLKLETYNKKSAQKINGHKEQKTFPSDRVVSQMDELMENLKEVYPDDSEYYSYCKEQDCNKEKQNGKIVNMKAKLK